ncbi:Ataxin-7-like protein 3 [Linnemannia gamsii]|uniref:SAGA-associated factor 11 n=1 Tax=Linnemannia gamsii TaxID=64522 RepID=A0A9P6UMG3_9FUNG|nr:Ataxin-7-like protein 3 [Linnemannia gamsii]
MSSTDMEALFAKIHKDQVSQLELLRHTKRAMDKTIASSKDSSDSAAASLASLSFEILGDLLDEIILDVVSEAHREIKNMRTVCPICKTKYGLMDDKQPLLVVVRAGQDIFGQNPQPSNSQTFDCVHCQRSFPAQRYAPHLEKCLGLAGRSSSRAASRRMGAERAGSGSPFTPVSYSDDREASDSDKDLIEKKRKKNASNNNFQSNGAGASGPNGGADYVTPSPAKPSSSKVKKQKPSKSGSSTKLKGLGLHTPSSTAATAAPRDPTPVGEISLGFLDDSLLLANGRSLQNGSGGGGNESGNGTTIATAAATTTATTGTTQKLSSSNPKRTSGGGVSSSKRPPGSGPSSKNGQVLSFYDSLRAIGSPEGASSDDDDSNSHSKNSHHNNIDNSDDYNGVNIHKKKKSSGDDGRRKKNRGKRGLLSDVDDDYNDEGGDGEYIDRDEDKGNYYGGDDEDFSAMEVDEHTRYGGVSGGGGSGGMVGVPLSSPSASYSSSSKASSQRLPPLVLRLKKSSAYSGASTDAHDMEFIDIDGDGDEDGMDVLQTPKKKKS